MTENKTIKIKYYKDPSTAIALDTIKQNKQLLIFCSSKKATESQAEKISKELKKEKKARNESQGKIELEKLSEEILNALSTPTKQCKRLAEYVKEGIAFHHAGLTSKQRELIEDAFKKGTITTITSTPTLAAGMDLPAFRTIIRDVKRYTDRGMANIPVLEYEQMAGRAGRPGKEDYGEAILIAKTPEEIEVLEEKYINGEVEEIYSKLAVEPVLRTYILSLVTSNIINDYDDLLHFFDQTFYAQQFGDLEKLHRTINKITKSLKEWGFLIKNQKEETKKTENKNTKSLFQTASEIIKNKTIKTINEKLEVTEIGKRVSELYIDPLTAKIIIKRITNIKNNIPINLIHLLTTTLEIRPLLRCGVKDFEMINHFLNEEELLIDEETFYEYSQDPYEDTIKTSDFFKDWINEYDEEKLLEKYNIRPGEINAKIQRMEWLLYATDELARMSNQKELLKHIRNLRVRIKNGVKEELLPLMNFKGIGRVKARKLYNNKIRNVKDIKKISAQALAQLVGTKLTISLKEQVGEPITEELKIKTKKIPKKHRKQTKLNEF